MFGKEPNECEEQSEDEDWGPYQKKKVRDASDICIAPTDGDDKDIFEKMVQSKISCEKRTFFRIPPDAIEKLRQFFAKNELPSRTVKEELSKELGISVEKVDRWFKNKRYAAIKTRKVRSQLRNAAFLKNHANATSGNFPAMKITANVPDEEQPFANEMSVLWALEKRLHQLKQRLLSCKDDNESLVNKLSGEESVIFVPIAEVIEKKTS